MVAAAGNTLSPAGCKSSQGGVLGRAHILFDMDAPCVLALLDFRSADQDRTSDRDHRCG
jgi:hypothetical protein